jgi:hypothetical protein
VKHPIDHHTEPYTGPTTFDLTPLLPILVHLAKGGLRGLVHEKPGLADVLSELATAVPGSGKAAGVTPEMYQTLLDARANVDKITQARAGIALLDQVLGDSLAWYENQGEQALGQIVDIVDSTAKRKKNAAIAKPFVKTIAYTKQTAEKAVKTRKKNAEDKAAGLPVVTKHKKKTTSTAVTPAPTAPSPPAPAATPAPAAPPALAPAPAKATTPGG